MRFFLSSIIILLLVSACSDDDMDLKAFESFEEGMYVINRGNEGLTNGSVSYYLPGCKQGTHGIFLENNSTPIPGVLRDLAFTGAGEVLLLLPDRIIIADENSFVQVDEVTGFENAQQIEVLSPNKAYVSKYNGPGTGFGIMVLDISARSFVDSLLPAKSVSKLTVFGSTVFTANSGGAFVDSTVSMINAISDEELGTFTVGPRPVDFEIDKNGDLWTLCEGVIIDPTDPEDPSNIPGRLVQSSLGQILSSFSLGAGARNLVIDNVGENLFFVNRGWTYELNINANVLPSVPFQSFGFNGYNVDPENNILVGCNAGTFEDRGEIWLYDLNVRDTLGTFQVGVVPLEVVFR
ncbi:MAG: hypothetical protein HKN16_10870 [Saprospiraceae bacterium]|nr:hypothetical protein [Saprospiraceae bacterium]